MKSRLLLFMLVIFLLIINNELRTEEKNDKNRILGKSKFKYEGTYNNSTFPQPFNETNNSYDNPAVSTGYYFVDSDDDAGDYWRPNPEIIDTLTEPTTWRRILSVERQKNPGYWLTNPDGWCFFRNPGIPASGDYFNNPTDSTDDAIAGPIPLGFDFYFNGLKYDSFYVSTNGIIALSNRRYHYNSSGNRTIPAGENNCYNKYGMDWFARNRTADDGLNDPVADDFGYKFSVCGGNPTDNLAGIRMRGGSLDEQIFIDNRSALIAPFFGDLALSQYDSATNSAQDYSKVYFKRSVSSDKMIIYFINIVPVRNLITPNGNYYGNFNLRKEDNIYNNYISVSAQVVLDKKDSSIQIIYERFDGVAVVNGRGVSAPTIFRYNTTCGVAGYARHTNNLTSGDIMEPWAGEYWQSTHYFMKYNNPLIPYPHSSLAIKFKQWKNILRVADIQYRVRKTDKNADLNFSDVIPTSKVNNYEILAGEERIGTVQPVGLIQNLTNNLQGPNGVNFQEQQLTFMARCRIINRASFRIVYNRVVQVDSACLALPDSLTADCTGDPNVKVRYMNVSIDSGNYNTLQLEFPGTKGLNGIPPYGFVQVFFPPFVVDEYNVNLIGRMKVSVIAEPKNPETFDNYNDLWAFDDTLETTLFVMKRLGSFTDDFSQFHIVERAAVPSTLKWVNTGAEVASGDDVSHYPLPPRGDFNATNNSDFNFLEPNFNNDIRPSPVARMNRMKFDGNEPDNSPGGDQLISFPIDLRGRFGSVLALSIQRNLKKDDWPRGWTDQELTGPEPRAVVNGDVFSVWNQYPGAASSEPDEIRVEFAQSSPDGVQQITNIDESRWRNHPRRKGAEAVTNMSAYTLFGAGGYMAGFLETDKDSALSPPANGLLGGLRPDLYDDGIDFEYKKVFIAIPDTFIKAANEGAKNFRFRIKVNALNSKKCITCIPDDDDPFFIDNVKLYSSGGLDIELTKVNIVNQYTMLPATQAIKIPVIVKVTNNVSVAEPPFGIKVKIIKQGDSRLVYCRTENIPFMSGESQMEINMPVWNARERGGPGNYRIYGYLQFGDPGNPDYDLEPLNDTNYTDFQIRFGDSFAYDPILSPRNDVPDNAFSGYPGRGLNLFGGAFGGNGSIQGPSGNYEDYYGYGDIGGSGSGQIAMKFKLTQADTIYGYKEFWGTLNCSLDDIALAIYSDSSLPGSVIPGTLVYKYRQYDDLRFEPFCDEYITHIINKGPVVLPAGTYWLSLAQMGETGFELGASKTRMGMRTTSISIPSPVTSVGPVGNQGYNLIIDKSLRKKDPSGNLVNDNLFAYENTRGSGQWVPFMPTIGNPGYAHLHHFGISPADNYTATLSRGTWIPMIRPYFGNKSYNNIIVYDTCRDEIPVELLFFNGFIKGREIELYWQTASEINNLGFYVDKREETDENWSTLGFVDGAGNSMSIKNYSYTDKNPQEAKTYHYRLRQVDIDGSTSCTELGKTFVIKYTPGSDDLLKECVPNPMKEFTSIKFLLIEETNINLEIFDLLGNKVKTIFSGVMKKGEHEMVWKGKDEGGITVSNGAYLIRLNAGGINYTSVLTVVR